MVWSHYLHVPQLGHEGQTTLHHRHRYSDPTLNLPLEDINSALYGFHMDNCAEVFRSQVKELPRLKVHNGFRLEGLQILHSRADEELNE